MRAFVLVWWAVALALAGLVVAQGLDPGQIPSDWPGFVALLLSGSTGVGVLIVALRKGVNWDELVSSKTTWTALSAAFGAVALYSQGQINLVQLLGALYLSLVTIFLRDAVASAQKQLARPAKAEPDEDEVRLMP